MRGVVEDDHCLSADEEHREGREPRHALEVAREEQHRPREKTRQEQRVQGQQAGRSRRPLWSWVAGEVEMVPQNLTDGRTESKTGRLLGVAV